MYACMGEWAGNTFGSRPWLKTDLARSQKRSASGSPLRCSGDLIHFSVACSLYHTLISPHASSLLSYIMMQHTTLVWNHRRGLSGCWSLPPFGKQWRRKKYHQLHTRTHKPPGKIQRDPSAETSVTLSVWVVMLKGILIIRPTQGETGLKSLICFNYTASPCSAPTWHSLVFQMDCTAVTAFCKPSNPPKEG